MNFGRDTRLVHVPQSRNRIGLARTAGRASKCIAQCRVVLHFECDEVPVTDAVSNPLREVVELLQIRGRAVLTKIPLERRAGMRVGRNHEVALIIPQ